MSFSIRNRLLGGAFGLVLGVGLASGSVVTYMDTETLARLSPVIVKGEVESILSAADSGYSRIHTYVTVRIEERLKGARGLDRVTLRLLGGRVGEHRSVVFGMPSFRTGERVVLFARPAKSGALTVTGLFQGKYRIEVVNGVDVAVRQGGSGGSSVLARGQQAEPAQQPLSEFLVRVRALASRYPGDDSSATSFAPQDPASSGVVEVEVHDAFTFLGEGDPACPECPLRWFEPDSGAPVSFSFNPTGAPSVVPGGASSEFVTALGAWTDVAGASIVLSDGGTTSAECFVLDGTSAISHDDPCGEIEAFDSASCSGVLAIGGVTGIFPAVTKVFNGVTFTKTAEGDVVFNSGAACFWAVANNYEEVTGHEVGHSIGFGHSCDDAFSPPCSSDPVLDDALLRAFAHGDGRGADPRDDDIDGLRFMYPPDGFVDAFLNGSAYSTGDDMDLIVDANGTAVVDAYVAIFIPGGTFFTLGPGGVSPPGAVIPIVTSITMGFFPDVPVFSYTFTGLEPAGTYTWYVVLVPPGADPTIPASWISIDGVSFTFTP